MRDERSEFRGSRTTQSRVQRSRDGSFLSSLVSRLWPLFVGGFLFIAGCAAPRVAEPVTAKLGGSSDDDQIEFWHTLNDRPITSNDDALHGMLLYLDGTDHSGDYAGRVKAMTSRGLLPLGFKGQADEAVDRGTVAVMIATSLNVQGGWAMHVFGQRNPRYAVRELQYKGLFPPSSENQTFSGAEFVGIIGRVEDYQRGTSANLPAANLPGQ
jgi:hypothetical protein